MESLLPLILSMLANLFKNAPCMDAIKETPTPIDPQKYITNHYDVENELYDDWIVAQTIPQVRQAAREEGVRLRPREVRKAAIRALEKARLAPKEAVAALVANPFEHRNVSAVMQ